jgi:hypothetical protein
MIVNKKLQLLHDNCTKNETYMYINTKKQNILFEKNVKST